MPRARRQKPNDLKNVHDRRASHVSSSAIVAPIIVDDPLGLDPGDKIAVLRNLRNDPLAGLHARRTIDDAQYEGGRAFQNDFETIERGPQAVDPSKPYVDCSRGPQRVSDAYSKALGRLNIAQRKLGYDGSAITHAVLIDRKTYRKVAESRGLTGERWEKYFGMRFQECLDCLALVYGFAMEKR